MNQSRPRARLRKLLTLTALSAMGAGALSLAGMLWTWYAHYDDQRHQLSRALWEKRQDAYAELVAVAARAAAAPRSTEEYAELHERFYDAYGRLEIYRTHELGACATTLRDTLYACATPDRPHEHRYLCDLQGLHLLFLRVSNDARRSLARSWDQRPDEFVEDRFDHQACGLGTPARAADAAAE